MTEEQRECLQTVKMALCIQQTLAAAESVLSTILRAQASNTAKYQ